MRYNPRIMPPLRPYQQTLLRQVQDTLAATPQTRAMLQLPTGGGKTIIAGALLAQWLDGGRRKAAWLTHRRELAEQTRQMLTNAGISAITNVNWTPGADAPAMAGGAVILMAQTVGRRNRNRKTWGRYDAGDLLIIDEAHHAAADGWARAMRQWPGPVLGMTATPWRLSEKEGFDHLFDELICGPQSAELQTQGYLCPAQVLLPPPDQRIAGGAIDHTGDYSESGIEQANRDRPEVMTARALDFWRRHSGGRPTIAYAVSVDHAHNLASVCNDAGIPAAVLLGDTPRAERDAAIAGFRDGGIKMLVNVQVATEGFDLPDASCIIIARPTMSLALYLQMVGRGLRPKDTGGDCIILDLAGNSVTHGLPEDWREWSLKPRGKSGAGVGPTVRCEKCDAVSPASSHNCRQCGAPFGKDCDRCGKWRGSDRWIHENHCGDAHQLVCDLCHIDAHIRAHLPVMPPLDDLVGIYEPGGDEMTTTGDFEVGDDLANRLLGLFGKLLAAERQIIAGADDARRDELRQLIEQHDADLRDDPTMNARYNQLVAAMPEAEHPRGPAQVARVFTDLEESIKSDLAGWRNELSDLESRPIDHAAIFNSARNKALYLLGRAAQADDALLSNLPNDGDTARNSGTIHLTQNGSDWHQLADLDNSVAITHKRPTAVRLPDGAEKAVTNWREFYAAIAEWLIDAGLLSQDNIPGQIQNLFANESSQYDSGTSKTRELKNGMFLSVNQNARSIVGNCRRLLATFGQDSAQFAVRLS